VYPSAADMGGAFRPRRRSSGRLARGSPGGEPGCGGRALARCSSSPLGGFPVKAQLPLCSSTSVEDVASGT